MMKQDGRKETNKKPTLVALHGLGSTPHFFDELQVLLPEYKWLTLTIPGHMGRSPLPEMSFSAVATCLQQEIPADELYIVMGHSWGAEVARELACSDAHEQVRGVILLDGAYLNGRDFGETLESELALTRQFIRETRFVNQATFLAQEKAEAPYWNKTREQAALAQMSLAEDGSLHLAIAEETACQMIEAMHQVNQEIGKHRWPREQVPVTLLAATKPKGIREIRERAICRIKRNCPQIKVEYLPTGHDCLVENGKRVAEIIRQTLVQMS